MTATPDIVRILLVEDDEDDYVMTRDLLDEVPGMDLRLHWVCEYDEALELVLSDRARFDLCLFDYRLGENTGLDLLHAVRNAGNHVPVIMLTGQREREIDLEAMHAGAADYLLKGEITSGQLERSIRYTYERARADRQISQLAFYDNLTGLPNRVLFKERLDQALLRQRRTLNHTAVMFLDIDDFKRINDTLGHQAGDELLKSASERLHHCLRQTDTVSRKQTYDEDSFVARLGGDEFTVLLGDVRRPEDTIKVARRLLAALAEPFRLHSHEVYISASIGIAISPTDGETIDELLRNADTAMYQVKTDGKNGFKFYEAAMHSSAMERLKLESALRQAIHKGEFELFYQPQYSLQGQALIGVEALVRWRTSSGLAPPGQFIPLAEETGLIQDIGAWVLREACVQSRRWLDAGFAPLRMSVNLSSRQFEQPDLVELVTDALEQSGIHPGTLLLEITEGTLMRHRQDTDRRIRALRQLGVGFALDDFGTGYSSLSHLKRFPLSAVKIDRYFTANLGTNSEDEAIATAIITLAHGLGLVAVAEGIETREQWEFLAQRGCNEGQGFLMARPQPAAVITDQLPRLKIA